MKKRKKITLVLIIVFIVALAVTYFIGSKTFLKKSADENPSTAISTRATVTYKDSGGAVHSGKSNIDEVSKVTLFRIRPIAQGRTGEILTKTNFDVSFMDPSTAQEIGKVNSALDQNGAITPDWTSFIGVSPNGSYDLRISAPGFLSRKLENITLANTDVLAPDSLRAGDINQDHQINWQDYVSWKVKYGQDSAGEPEDFNGDGKINFYDYALSFGTRCYNAKENNQDTWCNQ